MAKGFNKLNLKAAVKAHSNVDLSSVHLTTTNFGEILPLYCVETIPGDKFNVSANYFSRMAPLAKPTYGKFSFNTMDVFVPYFQVCDEFEGFAAGGAVWEGKNATTRFISNINLMKFAISVSSTGTSGNSDFSLIYENGAQQYRKFTKEGKFFMKILNSLGYSLPQNADMQTGSTWYTTVGAQLLSALPLLAFLKAYNDTMSQSQKFNHSTLTSCLRAIKHDESRSNVYTNVTHEIVATGIKTMLQEVLLQYENNYFTSAWRNPNNPMSVASVSYNPHSFYVPGKGGNYYPQDEQIHNSDNAVYYSSAVDTFVDGDYIALSQRGLDFLKSFDDWVRRNNYSGSRAVQRIYSRFGIKTDDYRSDYAHVIGTDKTPVQVGDVTSMSDTSGATLGEYAGKGILNGGQSFSFKAEDYGMLFIFGWYTVQPLYPYGCDRSVLKTSPLDYYNPEFDGLGAQAISYREVFENPNGVSGDTYLSDQVFGFTERYNEYRFGRDKVTGEFRRLAPGSADTATAWNVWHNARNLSGVRAAGELLAQYASVNSLAQTDSEYNRMFNVTSGDEDKFYLTCQFNVNAIRPILSLNQVPRLGEGDTAVPRNGNVIN